MAAKATGKVGPLARGGKRRVPTVATAHDFHPEAPVTPVGLAWPALAALFLDGMTSKVPRDGLVDGLVRWWDGVQDRFAHSTPWVLTLDNGPENHSRRPQCMRRLVDFAHASGLTVRLAYYPPSHRKYNPIERCWGLLENPWNGALLDSIEAVSQLATTLPWKGRCPIVARVTATYQTGVKLTKDAMQMVATKIQRFPGLDKWFVDIVPTSATIQAP